MLNRSTVGAVYGTREPNPTRTQLATLRHLRPSHECGYIPVRTDEAPM